MKRKRIGVIFGSFEAKTLIALQYLVLAQNRVQQSFEFEILPRASEDDFLELLDSKKPQDPEEDFLELLDSKKPQDRGKIEEQAQEFVKGYKDWLKGEADEYESEYDCKLTRDFPDKLVFVTKLKFSDYFYVTGDDNWTILALGNWERSMAPPSIVEFILTLLVNDAIDAACRGDCPDAHHATKACVSDFTDYLDEARYNVLVGYLCPTCERSIEECGGAGFARDARVLLSREWLGSADDPTAPAAIAKKLGFDLFQTRGFKPSAWERAIEVLQQDWMKTVLQLVGGLALAALIVWFGLKGT
jgi:hypothetical protein